MADQIIEYVSREEQRRIHKLVQKALRSGELVKATKCAWCGDTTQRLHGHHHDYARPLMVVWLCARCHFRHHSKYKLDRFFYKQGLAEQGKSL